LRRNTLFIGFMGSGKSQVGRGIAKKLGKLFIDSDATIENLEDRKILDIFKSDGEKYFRDMEREFAKQIKNSVTDSIISLGGGFPTAVNSLKELGFVVYLDIDFDVMVNEISKYPKELEKRPLLQDLDMARKIYNSRKEIYLSQSDWRLEVNPTDIEGAIERVLEKISGK
jgi:shikimate kinase